MKNTEQKYNVSRETLNLLKPMKLLFASGSKK